MVAFESELESGVWASLALGSYEGVVDGLDVGGPSAADSEDVSVDTPALVSSWGDEIEDESSAGSSSVLRSSSGSARTAMRVPT